MKATTVNLLENVVTTYDQTKTTIKGMVRQGTIDGVPVLGPPLNKWIDVITDTAQAPSVLYVSDNPTGDTVRVFTVGTVAAGVINILLYNFNIVTGEAVYVGALRFNTPTTPTTTHTVRNLHVLDSGTTGWKVLITTIGSVVINGGLFMANNIDLADFVPIGFATIPLATGDNQKAVYFLQDPSAIGAGQLNIASVGTTHDPDDDKIYVHNGVSATHQFFVYDLTITPTWSSAPVTIDDVTDEVTNTGHTFNTGDQVVFTVVTATGLVAGTVYFVRDVVAGTSYKLAATSGGAAINITAAGTGTIGRAFGITGSNWSHKTGNLPTLAGTLLLTNSEKDAMPTSGSNAGFRCIAMATSTNLYLGRVSDLTTGATTWPSLAAANVQGALLSTTALTATSASWSDVLDRFTFVTAALRVHVKPLINNQIDLLLGSLRNQYLVGSVPDIVDFGFTTILDIIAKSGWLFATGGTVGQQGILATPIYCNSLFDESYIITKVVDTRLVSDYIMIATIEKLYDWTTNTQFYYRISGFGSESGGWTPVPIGVDLSSLATGQEVQFRILFSGEDETGNNPAQLVDFGIAFMSDAEISEYWEFSCHDSSEVSPSRSAFRMLDTYSVAVPSLKFKAYTLAGSLVVDHNTTANSEYFEYSSDDGVTWLPLGTIPNVTGTMLRYTFATPPGVDVRVTLQEV